MDFVARRPPLYPSSLIAIKSLTTAQDPAARHDEKLRKEIAHIESLKKIYDPFAQDPDYQLVKGNSDYGIAVLYPQIHYTRKIVQDMNGGGEIKRQMYLSQKNIYQDFFLKKPKHIYNEGMPLWAIQSFEQEVTRDKSLKLILYKLNNNQELTDEQVNKFLQIGGTVFYALHCRTNDIPVKLYPTVSYEDDQRIRAHRDGKCIESHHFFTTHREEELAKVVMQTAPERNGEPAYITFGREHQFATAFSTPESPALYRRRAYPGLSDSEIRVQYSASNMMTMSG